MLQLVFMLCRMFHLQDSLKPYRTYFCITPVGKVCRHCQPLCCVGSELHEGLGCKYKKPWESGFSKYTNSTQISCSCYFAPCCRFRSFCKRKHCRMMVSAPSPARPALTTAVNNWCLGLLIH